MQKQFTTLITSILLVFFVSTVHADQTCNPDLRAIHKIIEDRYKGYKIFFDEKFKVIDSKYIFITFTYTTPTNESFGSGLALFDKKTLNLIWNKQFNGDTYPHSYSWFDFNKDGKSDLFFLLGFESVSETYLYISNIKTESFSNKNFILVYENKDAYSSLMDFDKDGFPEILDSGDNDAKQLRQSCSRGVENSIQEIPRYTEISETSLDSFYALPSINAEIGEEIISEYQKLVGHYGKSNFDYHMDNYNYYIHMGMFLPVRVIKVIGMKATDISRKFPEHYKWRINIINEIKDTNDISCSDQLEFLVKILKQNL